MSPITADVATTLAIFEQEARITTTVPMDPEAELDLPHEGSRYLTTTPEKDPLRAATPVAELTAVQDARQDTEQNTWWHNLFCAGPCFVNTSMDAENPPRRMDPPDSSEEDEMNLSVSDSSIHQAEEEAPPPEQTEAPIRFPSVHLESGDWGDGEADSSAFFQTEENDGSPAIGTRIASRMMKQQQDPPRPEAASVSGSGSQSIYRSKPPLDPSICRSKTVDAPAPLRSTNNCSNSSQASTTNTATTSKYGLYRSPAWSNDEESEVPSAVDAPALDEEDWDMQEEPADSRSRSSRSRASRSRCETPYSEYGDNRTHVAVCDPPPREDPFVIRKDDSKTVIDVTDMDDMFNDFSVSGGVHYGSSSSRRSVYLMLPSSPR